MQILRRAFLNFVAMLPCVTAVPAAAKTVCNTPEPEPESVPPTDDLAGMPLAKLTDLRQRVQEAIDKKETAVVNAMARELIVAADDVRNGRLSASFIAASPRRVDDFTQEIADKCELEIPESYFTFFNSVTDSYLSNTQLLNRAYMQLLQHLGLKVNTTKQDIEPTPPVSRLVTPKQLMDTDELRTWEFGIAHRLVADALRVHAALNSRRRILSTGGYFRREAYMLEFFTWITFVDE